MVCCLIEKCWLFYWECEFWVLFVFNLLLGLVYLFVVLFLFMFGMCEVGMSEFLFGVFMVMMVLLVIFFGMVFVYFLDMWFSWWVMLILGSVVGVLGYGVYVYFWEVWVLMMVGVLIFGVVLIMFL